MGGGAALLALRADTPATTSAARYGEIVARHARARRLLAGLAEAAERVHGHDLAGAEAALAQAREVRGAGSEGARWPVSTWGRRWREAWPSRASSPPGSAPAG